MSTHPLHANNFRRDALSRGNVMTSPGKLISAFKLENINPHSPLAKLGWTHYLPAGNLHSPDGDYTYVYQLFTDSYRVIHTVVKEDDLPCSKLMPGEIQYLKHLLINIGKDTPDMGERRFKASMFLGEELSDVTTHFGFNVAIKKAISRGYRLTPEQIEAQPKPDNSYSEDEASYIMKNCERLSIDAISSACQRTRLEIGRFINSHKNDKIQAQIKSDIKAGDSSSYTDADIKYIVENIGKIPTIEIANHCKKTKQSIVTWANAHGFSTAFFYTQWGPRDEYQLSRFYIDGLSIHTIAEQMERTPKQIASRVAVLIASGKYPDMKPRPRGRIPKIKQA
ncbi:Uncharacterised protein [Serratia quinivorans]|uniref:hypothetical protein n=1 Tax=Serratia quinivorans TaxID=137545 RepID=UPI002178D842|nr:hypothetical protein [Serratia quinivorans]CAI1818141.1 Uncharacterised protein [Serratia quinivorans]